MRWCLLPLLLALALRARAEDAPPPLIVERGDVRPLYGDAAPLRFEARFTVRLGSHGDSKWLPELSVSLPGRTFVATSDRFEEEDEAVAVVAFQSDTLGLLEAFEASVDNEGQLTLRRQHGHLAGADGELLVLVHLVNGARLQGVTNLGGGELVVDTRSLPLTQRTGEIVAVTNKGSGDLFVSTAYPRTIDVGSLDIATHGSGSIQFDSGDSPLVVDNLSIAESGSGGIAFRAWSIRATRSLDVGAQGSGGVCVAAASLNAGEINVAVMGSGTVSLGVDGVCQQADVGVVGSGHAHVGSIRCRDVTVGMIGSGDTIVRATHQLDGGKVGSGHVRYVGPRPHIVADKHHTTKWAEPAGEAVAAPPCHLKPSPPRVPVHVSVKEINIAAMRQAVLIPLLVAAVAAAWYVSCMMRRHRRPAEQPLLAQQRTGGVYV